MAASAGTNPGSAPDAVGVGVGVAVRLGVAVGDGESLGEGDASKEGEPLGVDVGAGLNAAAEVQPARTSAVAMAVTT